MEDRNKSKARTTDDEAERIVDLTPDMEVPEQSAVKIIDLTDAIDGPVESGAIDPSPSAAETLPDEPVVAPPEPEPVPASSSREQTPDMIEREVGIAFDAMQAPADAEAVSTESTDALLDRLSDIPRRVDESDEKPDTPTATHTETTPADSNQAGGGQNADEEALSADAAELEAAIAGDPLDDEEEIIELTDMVGDAGLQTDDFETDQWEEEIIELTEIADPAEMQADATEAPDEEIIELTEIVDAAMPGAEDGTSWDDTEVLELTDIVDPLEPENAPAGEETSEDVLAEDLGYMEIQPEEADPQEKQTRDSVIRLSDVLDHQSRKDERPPIEQTKMGAEEELVTQNVSPEAEDAAQALGLDLEQENRKEDETLTQREIETAVARIIQDKYAATIEKLIASAVEKAVSREIENIRRAMLDGDEPQA